MKGGRLTSQLRGSWTAQPLAIDYILGGPEQLFPAGKRGDGDHLDGDLRMFQRSRPFRLGEMEARIFYTPCFIRMKLDVRRAVRRLRWTKGKPGVPMPLLPSRVETYRVTPKYAKAVDQAAKEMEKAFTRLKLDMSIHWEFGTAAERPWLKRTSGLTRYRRRISASASPVAIDLEFHDAFVQPAVNSAWEHLWDAMGDCFQPKNRIRAIVRYPIDLRAYLVALGAK